MPFTVQVVTPNREIAVCDDATLLVAKGLEGDIGLMAGHAPVLIALSVGPLTIVRGEKRETMAVDGGFLQMNGETAIVLAEYVLLPKEIDIDATRAEIAELERRIAADSDADETKRRLARARVIEAVHGIERM
jgi:F-type H+-transporting ATPase subunit epsilon